MRTLLILTLILGSTATISAAEKPTLDAIIKEVRKQENLQANMAFEFDREVTPGKKPAVNAAVPAKNGGLDGQPKINRRVRVLLSGNKFSLRETGTYTTGAKKNSTSTFAASDGTSTRIVQTFGKTAYASLYDTRRPPDDLPLPNTMLFNNWNLPKPFSRFLLIPDDEGTTYLWSVLGEENVAGLKTVKLQFEMASRQTGTVFTRSHFWLATERSYQPVKIESYRPLFSTKVASSAARVTKFRKLKPGLWLPETTEIVSYDPTSLRKGKQVITYTEKHTLRSALLSPKVDREILDAVKIPSGAQVSVYKNGMIAKTYRQP